MPPDPRNLASVPAARRRWWPPRARLRAARRELALRSDLRLEARRLCLPYAAAARPPARGQVAPADPSAPVWQFWATGQEGAPPVVRRALDSVGEYAGARPRHVLDASSYRRFVTLPPALEARREQIGWTHFSDLLRVSLLAEHGGTWIDATVLLTGPLPAVVEAAPFFAFTRPEDPFLCSSWFLHSSAGHPIVRSLRAMLTAHWSERDEYIDYFIYHFLFEAAVVSDARFRSLWSGTPVLPFAPTHAVQDLWAEPLDGEAVRAALAGSWLHKLMWKTTELASPPGSIGHWLTSG